MHIHGAVNTVVGAQDAPEVFNHPELSFTASQAKVSDKLWQQPIFLSGALNLFLWSSFSITPYFMDQVNLHFPIILSKIRL